MPRGDFIFAIGAIILIGVMIMISIQSILALINEVGLFHIGGALMIIGFAIFMSMLAIVIGVGGFVVAEVWRGSA